MMHEWERADHGDSFLRKFFATTKKPVCLICIAALLLQVAVLLYGLGASWWTMLLMLFGSATFMTGAVIGRYWGE